MTELIDHSILHEEEMEDKPGDVFGSYTVSMDRF